MKKHDRIGGLIWLALGILICIGSVKLKLGDFHKPGPGFMPFLSGTFLVLFGLILTLSTILKSLRAKEEIEPKKVWVKENWKGFLFTLLALFGYAFLLEPLGFYITAFMFLFFLFKFTEPKGWLIHLFFAGVTIILSYLIFSVWLKCQFPIGIFRF